MWVDQDIMIRVHINCVKMKQVTLVFIASCLVASYGLWIGDRDDAAPAPPEVKV